MGAEATGSAAASRQQQDDQHMRPDENESCDADIAQYDKECREAHERAEQKKAERRAAAPQRKKDYDKAYQFARRRRLDPGLNERVRVAKIRASANKRVKEEQ